MNNSGYRSADSDQQIGEKFMKKLVMFVDKGGFGVYIVKSERGKK